jgi:glutamine synthetase
MSRPDPSHPAAHSRRTLALLAEEHVRQLRLRFTDILGRVRRVEVPPAAFERALHGVVTFDESSAKGFGRVEELDVRLRPDPGSLRIFPEDGRPRTAEIVCDVHRADDAPFEGDPRGALRRVLGDLAAEGLEVRVGVEVQYYLHLPGGATLLPPEAPACGRVLGGVVEALEGAGIAVDSVRRAAAPGQQRIDVSFGSALAVADGVAALKHAVRSTAPAHGVAVTFMPKPLPGENGSGLHLHHVLLRDGANASDDPDAPDGISDVLRWWIGGLLRNAAGFCAVTNPLVNSYKRLGSGFGAPAYATWSLHSRSPLVRIPAGRGTETRCELRIPDAAANPYLSLAAQLAAGLDGIRSEADPGPPLNKSLANMGERERRRLRLEPLPENLGAALLELERSRVVRAALGEHIFDHFMEAKRTEWAEYGAEVHPWELRRYLGD